MPYTLRQQVGGQSDNTNSTLFLTLPAPPLVGNLLVFAVSTRLDAVGPTAFGPLVWTFGMSAFILTAGNGGSTVIYWRTATDGTQTFNSNGTSEAKRGMLLEFRTAGSPVASAAANRSPGSFGESNGPPFPSGAVVMGAGDGVVIDTRIHGDNDPTTLFIEQVGWTTLDSALLIGAPPAEMLSYQFGSAGSYTHTPTGSVAAGASYSSAILALSSVPLVVPPAQPPVAMRGGPMRHFRRY